jgi:hypothetical protein
MDDDADPAAPGAAVTVALCGDWEHTGPCRWPHNNAIVANSVPARFRTLFVANGSDEQTVRDLIVNGLTSVPGWFIVSSGARPIAASEHDLAERLLRGPQEAH